MCRSRGSARCHLGRRRTGRSPKRFRGTRQSTGAEGPPGATHSGSASFLRSAVKVSGNLGESAAAQGSQFGPTEWIKIGQDRINLFADATDDHQWIHVDPEKAANGPFGSTIAHGLLTLSLLPHFSHQLYRVHNVAMAINYGYNKVRFITPVKVGANVRARGELTSVNQLDGAVQATTTITVEIEGVDKPAAVVESIVRYIA